MLKTIEFIAQNEGEKPKGLAKMQREKPEYPQGFTKKEKDLWDLIWEFGKVEPEDFMYVELLIDNMTLYHQLKTDLKRKKWSLSYLMPNKTWAPHPNINIMKDAQKNINEYLKQLGFSPAARAKIRLDAEAAEDPAAKIQEYFANLRNLN